MLVYEQPRPDGTTERVRVSEDDAASRFMRTGLSYEAALEHFKVVTGAWIEDRDSVRLDKLARWLRFGGMGKLLVIKDGHMLLGAHGGYPTNENEQNYSDIRAAIDDLPEAE